MGAQIGPGERREQFKAFLAGLGYQYRDETDNPAYRLFAGRG